MSYHLLSISDLGVSSAVNFPCYFAVSTAPINVEDAIAISGDNPAQKIREITDYLKQQDANAEILILIHGYNTDRNNVQQWYRDTCEYIAHHYPQHSQGLVVIGYRWSSEQISGDESGKFADKRLFAWEALPKFAKGVYIFSLAGIAIGAVGGLLSFFLAFSSQIPSLFLLGLFSLFLLTALFLLSPLLTLFLLRLSGYFRDVFRADQYGVSDLIELIRNLDDQLVESVDLPERYQREQYWQSKERSKVRLSFVGHSMGGFVVTNTVRILSDVFDRSSIGSLNLVENCKTPPSGVGNVFSLGRLVLVAPDIPAETLITGRANVLRSSLRRFEEAYLFSNEGDMALRLASSTANYFSYPTKTRTGGYRLGNVVVRDLGQMGKNNLEKAGILNLTADGHLIATNEKNPYLDYLYLQRRCSLADRQRSIFQQQFREDAFIQQQHKSIAELFTYFDCTNYQELVIDPKTGQRAIHPKTGQPMTKGIVSRASGKTSLDFLDYVALLVDSARQKVDPHGGYIFSADARFTKRLIYGLACLGWQGFLESLQQEAAFPEVLVQVQQDYPDLKEPQQHWLASLQVLNILCEARGLQVLLSPERYQSDIMGHPRDRYGY
ncbi:alpha/beta hydrolase [Alkalinema sp. FACHB-956]|uniref:alpha/beta hydrolase n=1 Tax=Alkalinema sp. FACHB-956 TaxID=2692768 RepID=UPI001684DEF3|nr:alpha/beta hydrolase [Alkalinema sp. FACHB-956]MBD2327384.1 alpha/beta hydrolase [Alkalinema sp. FACHB-956]